jgi:hypothetical protein
MHQHLKLYVVLPATRVMRRCNAGAVFLGVCPRVHFVIEEGDHWQEQKVLYCVLRSRVMYIVYTMSHIYFVDDAIYDWATVEAYQDFTQRLLVLIEDSSSI